MAMATATSSLSHDAQALLNILNILEAMKPGTDILDLWYEIGRAGMTAKIALGSRIEIAAVKAETR